MSKKKIGLNTICTHVGEVKDEQFKGAVSPMYLSSSYEFLDVEVKRYPRYFNTPNQEHLVKKIEYLNKKLDFEAESSDVSILAPCIG